MNNNSERNESMKENDALDDILGKLEGLRPSKSVSTSKDKTEAGVVSIVNHDCGKRISLSAGLQEKINSPQRVQIAFFDKYLVIAETIESAQNSYLIKKNKNKGILYAAKLVEEITEEFGLDFHERASITFHDVKYKTISDVPTAFVKIMKD